MLPAGTEDILSKTQARCWERPLEYAGLARMLTTGIQTKGPLEPDFHWAAPLLLWSVYVCERGNNIHYGVK